MNPLPILALSGKVKQVDLVDKYCDEVMGLLARRLRTASPARVIESIRDARIDQRLALEHPLKRKAGLRSRQTSSEPGAHRLLAVGSKGVAIQALRPLDVFDPSRCVKWLAHRYGFFNCLNSTSCSTYPNQAVNPPGGNHYSDHALPVDVSIFVCSAKTDHQSYPAPFRPLSESISRKAIRPVSQTVPMNQNHRRNRESSRVVR